MIHECDVLVLGSGIAGATAAVHAAEMGLNVIVLAKDEDPIESATRYAQGGIVYHGRDDSWQLLVNDIVKAGAGACYEPAARALALNGPPLVETFLMDYCGVEFDKDIDGALHLTAEAAHSRRRILHCSDATGLSIEQALLSSLARNESIRLMAGYTGIDLVTTAHHWIDRSSQHETNRCLGCFALSSTSGDVHTFLAPVTILATGGCGRVFLHTTNPSCATGDGIAMAYRAGVRILNAEFVQFHPTSFFHRDSERFLITEAVRGEGGRLFNHDGERFMERYDPERLELAPRDVVARSIYQEMARTDKSCVFLDIAHHASDELDPSTRFPTIYAKLLEYDIDITSKAIPVVPAAHYFCGGIAVDLNGATELRGLMAVGETACTGAHGANRLASTSLLEGLLWGWRAAEAAGKEAEHLERPDPSRIPSWNDDGLTEISDPLLVSQDTLAIRSTMWNYAGIVRTRKRLQRARADLDYMTNRIEQFYREAKLNRSLIELRNLVTVARLIVRAALGNRRSQGCHYRED